MTTCVSVVSKYLQKILCVNQSFLINQDAHIVLMMLFWAFLCGRVSSYEVWVLPEQQCVCQQGWVLSAVHSENMSGGSGHCLWEEWEKALFQ